MNTRISFLAAATSLLCVHCGAVPTDDHAALPGDTYPDGVELDGERTTVSAVLAAVNFTVSDFTVRGTGCSRATVVADDVGGPTLTAFFDAFESEGQAPIRGHAQGEVKSCNLAVTISPDPGYQVGLARIETRGSVDVFGPQDTTRGINNVVRVQRQYTFDDGTGSTGFHFPNLNTYIVNRSGAYTFEEGTGGVVTYGACNANAIAGAFMSLQTTGANNFGNISPLDQDGSIEYKLLVRACPSGAPATGGLTVVDGGENRVVVKNTCVLRGVGTSTPQQVCYDANGQPL